MKSIYIVGDSYCFDRENSDAHWPAALAKLLNLSLEGKGFPGEGWWTSRTHLINYINSAKFIDTEYFIFCHTEHCRVLSNDFVTAEVKDFWFKHIQVDEITSWYTQKWYLEINDLLRNKKIIHLRGFHSVDLGQLNGLKFTTPLIELSIRSAGGTRDNWHLDSKISKLMNENKNHLSPSDNIRLAERIHQVLQLPWHETELPIF